MATPLPRIDLTTFFLSISSAAFMGLGVVPASDGRLPGVDLELARQNIDLLELMQEKTRGNRTADEDQLIEKLLFETRLQFIEKQREIQKKIRKFVNVKRLFLAKT